MFFRNGASFPRRTWLKSSPRYYVWTVPLAALILWRVRQGGGAGVYDHILIGDTLFHESSVPSLVQLEQSPAQLFLDPKVLKFHDRFAASWWMSRERFENVDVSKIQTVEDDAFVPIAGPSHRVQEIRMARDWLDFSVEHLSKWQKLIGNQEGNAYAEKVCNDYVAKKRESGGGNIQLRDTYMSSTLAVIPLGVSDSSSQSTQDVWMAYLAATLASLIEHGVNRVAVVGYYDMDTKIAARAFDLVLGATEATPLGTELTRQDSFTHQATEMSYVKTTKVKTQFIEVNVPFGALVGLKEELLGIQQNHTTGSFLGKSRTKESFSFIFMTEADQILHARLSAVFEEEMLSGQVLVPHRLQPIPHSKDIETFSKKHLLGDEYHAPPISLSGSLDTDACCDTLEHYGERICENFWWICGYNTGNFSYFEPFEFMQLTQGGTGIVTLAGNEHGRMCRVKQNGRGQC